MKPTLVADEMFPEGANFMELDEVSDSFLANYQIDNFNNFSIRSHSPVQDQDF